MIKYFVVFVVLFVSLSCIKCQRFERGFANQEPYYQKPLAKFIPILRMELNNNGDGPYQYAYETGNNIAQQEVGDGTKSQGSYSYTAPDGQLVSMTYIADTNGFQAQGSHIPIAPPMPKAIQKALEQNLAEEARGIFDDGQYRVQYENNRA